MTATVIIFELTHARSDLLMPFLITVAGSVSVLYIYSKREPPSHPQAHDAVEFIDSKIPDQMPIDAL